MIDPRLLPEGFLDAYRGACGGDPPAEFLEAYEALCESLYFGTRLREQRDRTTGGDTYQYWFGEDRLLGVKAAVDRRVASLRQELRHWTATRARQGTRRQVPERAHGDDLGRAGGAGGGRPDDQEKGT